MGSCRRCGKSYDSEDKFCGFCGFNLAAQGTSELATQLSLKASDIHFNLGLRYLKDGKYQQALEAFEKTLAESPDDLRVQEMCWRAREALSESD